MLDIILALGLTFVLSLNPFGLVYQEATTVETVYTYDTYTLVYEDGHYYAQSAKKSYDLGDSIYYTAGGIIQNNYEGLCYWDSTSNSFTTFLKGDFSDLNVLDNHDNFIITGTTHYSEDNFLYNYSGNSYEVNPTLTHGFICECSYQGVLNYSKIFESNINERFTTSYRDDNYLYIGGIKEDGDGSLTSHGSASHNTVLYQLDVNYHVINTWVYPHQEIVKCIQWDSLSQKWLLVTPQEVIILKEDLDYWGYIETTSIIVDMLNQALVVWNEQTVTFYDINYGIKLDSISLVENVSTIHAHDNMFYVYGKSHYYLMDIYDTRAFYIPEPVCSLKEEWIVSSVFGTCLYKGESSTQYTPLINGVYTRTFNFQTVGALDFQITLNNTVPAYQNVVEDGIYPAGYALKFSGEAELNHSVIYNNYKCPIGVYTLTLKSLEGEERTIHFTVVDSLYSAEDFVYPADVVTSKDSVTLSINPLFDSLTVIQEDTEYTYPVEKDNLQEHPYVTISHLKEGYNFMRLKAIGRLPLNLTLCILYKSTEPHIKLTTVKEQIMGEIDDPGQTLRAIRLTYTVGQNEYYAYYALDATELTLDKSLIKDVNHVAFEVIYNTGDGFYNSYTLAEYDLSTHENSLFKVETSLVNNKMNQIIISPGNGLRRAQQCEGYIMNMAYYTEQRHSTYTYLLGGISVTVLGALAFIFIPKIIKRIKKRV